MLILDPDLVLPQKDLNHIIDRYTELIRLASEASLKGQPVLVGKYRNEMKICEWLFGIQEDEVIAG